MLPISILLDTTTQPQKKVITLTDDFQVNQIIFFNKDELYDILYYLISVRINIKYPNVESILNIEITLHHGSFDGIRYTAQVVILTPRVQQQNINTDDLITQTPIPITNILHKKVEISTRTKTRVPFVVIEQKIGINKKTSPTNSDDNKLIPGIGLVPKGFKINTNDCMPIHEPELHIQKQQ